MAILSASAHDIWNPVSHLSSTVLLQVFLRWPLFLFSPCAHVSVLGNESGFILNTCPIHLYLRVFICVHILSDIVLSLTSSFVTFIGQWIFRIFRKHLCWYWCPVCPYLFLSCATFRCHIRGQSKNLSQILLFWFLYCIGNSSKPWSICKMTISLF